MRTMRVLAGALLAACGLAAAAFLGAVSPADAGEKALPVRMADAEQAITIQGESLRALEQQVITIAGENFGARMDGLDKAVADLKTELAEARKENADLRGLLGAEVERLNARIDNVQATINARIDAEVAKLQGRLDATRAEITARDQVLYDLLHDEIEALDARLDALGG